MRCQCPLDLTEGQERSIAERVSGRESRLLGVESSTDEGEVPGQDMVEQLKQLPVFAGLGTKNLVKLLPTLQQRRYPKGTTIVHQGDEGDSFYVIRRGNVEVVLERGEGGGLPIARLGPTEGFGEMALLTGRPRSANVVAITDVEAWCISKADFDSLLSSSISLALYFSRVVSERLAALEDRITA
jgi:CRP-like cAMP-binding protein